jgi:hypothetical protein
LAAENFSFKGKIRQAPTWENDEKFDELRLISRLAS